MAGASQRDNPAGTGIPGLASGEVARSRKTQVTEALADGLPGTHGAACRTGGDQQARQPAEAVSETRGGYQPTWWPAAVSVEVIFMERGASGGTPLAMRVRGLRPDRNPLRRASDRAEFAVVVVLLAALLAGAPLTTLAAARWAAASGLRAGLAQAGRHRVTAVLLHDAPATAGSLFFPAPEPQVLARWTGPEGPRTGMVDARPGARAGSAVTVWTDRSGRLARPAAQVAGVVGQVVLAVLAALVTLSVLLLVLWAYAGIFLDWRRMAAWDADWAATEPRWTGRR